MTNADAIRSSTDEWLAELLSGLTLEAVKRTAESVTRRLFMDFELDDRIDLANEAIGKICEADTSLVEWYLRWLKAEYGQVPLHSSSRESTEEKGGNDNES